MIEPHCKPPFSRQGTRTVGHVEWDGARGTYRLIDDSNDTWIATLPESKDKLLVRKGAALTLSCNMCIQFGGGKRIAKVIELNKKSTRR